jgi:hypothetical protein
MLLAVEGTYHPMELLDRIVNTIRYKARLFGFKDIADIDPFTCQSVPDEQGPTDLHRLFYQNDGPMVHKWIHYLDVYERHLSRFRDRPFRLLEIGVYHGGSLHLWRRYFGPKAVIFGIDIDPQCATFNGKDGMVRIGSQDDPAFLRSVVDEMGGVDVVIDDGSHIASHQRASFDILFPLLASDGIYICEDLHTSYWRGFLGGGYRRRTTFVETAKRLIDDIHSDFHRKPQSVRDAHRIIDGLHFYNSMVVIEKRPRGRPSHIKIGKPRETNDT